MEKFISKYCKKCCCKTIHSYVGKQIADGDYIALAVFSFGLSLLADPRHKYYKCVKCGEIEKK